MVGSVRVRSAVRGGGGEGVRFGWRQHWRQLGHRSWSWQRILASARESTSGTAAGECVGIRDSINEGVGVGDGRGGYVTCVVGGKGGAVTCVVGGSEGVSGVWLAAVRSSAASSLQRHGESGSVREGVGGVWYILAMSAARALAASVAAAAMATAVRE